MMTISRVALLRCAFESAQFAHSCARVPNGVDADLIFVCGLTLFHKRSVYTRSEHGCYLVSTCTLPRMVSGPGRASENGIGLSASSRAPRAVIDRKKPKSCGEDTEPLDPDYLIKPITMEDRIEWNFMSHSRWLKTERPYRRAR